MESILKIIADFEKFISEQHIFVDNRCNISFFIHNLDRKIKDDILKRDILESNARLDESTYIVQNKICELNLEIKNNINKKNELENKLKQINKQMLQLKLCGRIEEKINFMLDSNYENQTFSDEMWFEINKRTKKIDSFVNNNDRLFIIYYILNNKLKMYTFIYYDFPKINIEIKTKCEYDNELQIIQSKDIWFLPKDNVWQYTNLKYFNLNKLIQECIISK